MSEQRQRRKRGFWRVCRIYFRRFRILVWLVILTLLGCLIYLNQVGLPQFVKTPLLQGLRKRGVDLQFSRLRVRWYQGIVAEDVRFGQIDQPDSPQLTLGEVQVGLNFKALTRRQLQVDELIVRQGSLSWSIQGDTSRRELTVRNIETHLRFLPDDQWLLEGFNADFVNAQVQLRGTITNASALAQLRFFHGERTEPASAALWQQRLRRLADVLDRIHFSATPELSLEVDGDAKSLSSFSVRMSLAAPDAETPWGAVSGARFTARLLPADTNGTLRALLNLEAADAQTPWACITNFQMDMRLTSSETHTNLIQGELKLSTREARTEWASGSNVAFSADWIHAITNPIPISGRGRLHCDETKSRWGDSRDLELTSRLSLPDPTTLPEGHESWAWWTNIHPYWLDWRCALREFNSPKLSVSNIVCAGVWRTPKLSVTNFLATVHEQQLDVAAGVDVATRRVNARVRSGVDPRNIAAVLTEGARRWLGQFTWNSTPQVEGQIALTLPAWTNRQPDWRAEVQPTLDLNGSFNIEAGGTYRGVEVSSASSRFSYSSLNWHLADLVLCRPEGVVIAEHRASDRTKDFYWHITSSVDPGSGRPLLDTRAQKGFDLIALTEPPVLEAEVWGRSRAPERLGVKARVSLTNFSFRGESATSLQTAVTYTNKILQFLQPRLERGDQRASAGGITADFNTGFVYFTNGFSTVEPMVIARAIGPKIGRTIEPYVFSNPPVGYVEGTIPMHGEEGADLRFQLEGGPFHWWKFNVPWIAGRLHWSGLTLTMRDVRVSFYQGQASGVADFKFPKGKACEFTCSVVVTNCLLQELMTDIPAGTNRLEGRLNATLNFTQANTEDWNSLFGYGELKLRDGLIWDIPLFGIFTPMLNGISPGLGNTRASAGVCTYYITNGIIRTDDLEIRSAALRLQYRGTVDLESRVNARVEAELLRDMWVVGPIVSTVLWPVTKMFEYRVTGTLGEPKTEPVYIVPKLVLMPFHPFRTFKSLLPEDPSSRTKAPPVFKDYQP